MIRGDQYFRQLLILESASALGIRPMQEDSQIDPDAKTEDAGHPPPKVASFSQSLGRGLARSYHDERTRYFKAPTMKRRFNLAWQKAMRSPRDRRFRNFSAALLDICNSDILLATQDDNQYVLIVIVPGELGRFALEFLVIERDWEKGVQFRNYVSPVVVTRHLASRFFQRVVREQIPASNNEVPDELRKLGWLCMADPQIVARHLPPDSQATWRIRTETGVAVVVLTHESGSFLATTWMPTIYAGSTGNFEIESLLHVVNHPEQFAAALLQHADIEKTHAGHRNDRMTE